MHLKRLLQLKLLLHQLELVLLLLHLQLHLVLLLVHVVLHSRGLEPFASTDSTMVSVMVIGALRRLAISGVLRPRSHELIPTVADVLHEVPQATGPLRHDAPRLRPLRILVVGGAFRDLVGRTGR